MVVSWSLESKPGVMGLPHSTCRSIHIICSQVVWSIHQHTLQQHPTHANTSSATVHRSQTFTPHITIRTGKCHPHTQILTTSLKPSHTRSTVPAHRDFTDTHASLTAPTNALQPSKWTETEAGLFLWWGEKTRPNTTNLLHTYDLRQAYTVNE